MGKVVNEGSSHINSGVFKIVPSAKIPNMAVKDFRHNPALATMDAFKEVNFPFSILDENTIAPCKTLPGSSGEALFDITPVFLLHANFITGGLLLTFVGQHNTMDMTGQGHVMHLFSKACCNEQFTSEELSSGNQTRRNLIPLLGDSYQQAWSSLIRWYQQLYPNT